MESEAMPLILIVEDDRSLANWISDFLSENQFEVMLANKGNDAIELVKLDDPDCRTIRPDYKKPILMLTARGEEQDEVRGLEFGASDYMVKPVRPRVLLARINLLLDRNQALVGVQTIRQFGEFKIDSDSRNAWVEGDLLDLSTNEFDLLWLLVENASNVMSREDIMNALRNLEYDGFNRSIDVAISRIRRKLNDDSSKPKKLKTVWGKGYMFVADAW